MHHLSIGSPWHGWSSRYNSTGRRCRSRSFAYTFVDQRWRWKGWLHHHWRIMRHHGLERHEGWHCHLCRSQLLLSFAMSFWVLWRISSLPLSIASVLLASSVGLPSACPWTPRARVGVLPLRIAPGRLLTCLLVVGLLLAMLRWNESPIVAGCPFLPTFPTARERALHDHMAGIATPRWLF